MAIALHEAGLTAGADLAIGYLENQLDEIDDAYTMAIVSYALELGKSSRADDAYDQLLSMAIRDENGLHWERPEGQLSSGRTGTGTSVAVENTGYAVLALLEHGDSANAGEAVGLAGLPAKRLRWILFHPRHRCWAPGPVPVQRAYPELGRNDDHHDIGRLE